MDQKQQIIEKVLINNSLHIQANFDANKQATKTMEAVACNTYKNAEEKNNIPKKVDQTKKSNASMGSIEPEQKVAEKETKINNGNNEKKNVFIVGDSLVNGINERGLAKQHDEIVIKAHGGATTRDMVDYIKPVLRKKPDVIILHTGTNDLTKGVDTISQLEEISELVMKDENKSTELVISTVVTRGDRTGMSKRITNLNKRIKKFCADNDLKTIEYDNIDFSCLAAKRLHLNKRGDSILVNNFINFLSRPKH